MKQLSPHWPIFLLLLITTSPLHAAVYKWINDEGHTTYSATPPPAGYTSIRIGVDSSTPTPAAQPAPKRADKAIAENTTASGTTSGEQQYTKEQQHELCTSAQKDLAQIAQGGRMRVKQEDGSTSVMSDEDRNKRIETMQNMVKKHCK